MLIKVLMEDMAPAGWFWAGMFAGLVFGIVAAELRRLGDRQ